MAEQILSDPQALRSDTLIQSDDFPKIHIGEALLRASESRTWTAYTRKEDSRNCEYFLEWVDKAGFTYWHELRFEHVQEYQKSLRDRGLAFDTVRLYLLPIRRTAAWIAANWPKHYVNICQNIRLSRSAYHPSTYDEEEGNPYLPIHRLLDFLDWMSRDAKRDQLTVGVALQGLVGLQMQEALRLKWEKVDLDEATITIDGVVKNRYRIRKIPIANVVGWILRQFRDSANPTGLLISWRVRSSAWIKARTQRNLPTG